MTRPVRTIKKYANRRLYDTESSQSITLADVRDLIGSGERVCIVEAKSGRDVTRAILLQIVADQELMGRPALSDEVLTAIIRLNSNPARDLVRNFFEQGLRQLDQQRSSLHQAWREGLKRSGLDSVAGLSEASLAPFARFQRELLSIWSNAADAAAGEQRGGKTGKDADA